jgi:hypothetical protein
MKIKKQIAANKSPRTLFPFLVSFNTINHEQHQI